MDIIGNVGSLVNLNLSVLLIQIVNLFILMILLNAILYKPVLRIMNQREEIIRENLKQAEEIKVQAEQRIVQARRNVLEAKERARAMLLKTERLLENYREENIKNLRKENEQILQKKLKEIEGFKGEIESALQSKREDFQKMILSKML